MGEKRRARSPSERRKPRSRSRSRRKPEATKHKKPVTARSASPSEDSGDRRKVKGKPGQAPEESEEESVPLEARVALLEVENATLKAENMELKKKLVEVMRKQPPSAAPSSNDRSGAPPAKEDRRLARAREAETAKASDDRGERRLGGGLGQPSPVKDKEPPRRQRESEAPPENDVDMQPNAIMLVNGQMEVYNISITNNVPPEKRLPLVKDKLDKFMPSFDEKIQILDLNSGKPVIRDKKMFTSRYTCVFRESGAKLLGTCNKRFYYDSPGGKATYCIDYEKHDSLVTAMPGTPPDGNLGVREPRTEHLIVLYEAKGGKITRMWLRPDADKIGMDTHAGEDIIVRSDAFKAFEKKIEECKGGPAGERIFHNYHDVPTVG